MKKFLPIIVACVCVILLFVGLGFEREDTLMDENTTEMKFESTMTEETIPLQFDGSKIYENSIETAEGIKFSCSDNFVIGEDEYGFGFGIKSFNGDYETTAEIYCDHEITRVEYYSHDDQLLSKQEFTENNNSVSIKENYNEEYCCKVTLYIKGEDGNIYTADFYRYGV